MTLVRTMVPCLITIVTAVVCGAVDRGDGSLGPPASHAAPSKPDARGVSTWVWSEAEILDAGKRRHLLDFVVAQKLGSLFVHAAPAYEGEAGFDALAEVAVACAQTGTEIAFVGGDPSWALEAHRADAAALVDRVARINDRLGRRGLRKTTRVLFDVEPYLLEGYRSSPDAVLAQYVSTLDVLHVRARGLSLEVWQTIPFWLSKHSVGGQNLERAVLDRSDGLVVMAYRNQARDVQALATPILERAAATSKPVVVAIETMCVQPARVTFCGSSARALEGTLKELAGGFGAYPSFSGLAVHQYASFRTIEDSR